MGKTNNLVLNEPPKNLEYIEKLLHYDSHSTFLEKAKKWFTQTNETRPHSKSQWCKILGSTENNTATRSFLEKLIEKEALVHEETRGKPPNTYDVYRLDKTRLEEIIFEDPFWNWIRDISIRMINNQEPYKKVVTDI